VRHHSSLLIALDGGACLFKKLYKLTLVLLDQQNNPPKEDTCNSPNG
jgi:hypothetical protein